MYDESSVGEVRCDVCVVGAGIAGLNALWVASRYLTSGQRAVLVDRRQQVGGMWVDTYDYVRLHQPHPFFTTGNEKWTLGKDPSHLATKPEVLAHLRHCLEEIKQRVQVTELLGHELEQVEENTDGVRITCRSGEGSTTTIVADKLIRAFGFNIEVNEPLAVSSSRVRSVSPDFCDVRVGKIAEDDAPVWIIGGGKTAMDTAHELITCHPGRDVNLLAGAGTFFSSRDRIYPRGAQRWWLGLRPNSLFSEAADRFDGTNETDVLDWARSTFGTMVTPRADHNLLGLLSEAESAVIRRGLNQMVMDHLDDVVDVNGTTQMRLRSGASTEIDPGSWIVNCTGYLKPREDYPDEPYVSPGGRVLTVGPSPMFGFSSFGAYFMAHLLFLGKITTVPLYQMDALQLVRVGKAAAPPTVMTMVQYNLGQTFDNVPVRVFSECGLDFDRWYPLPRRLTGQVQFMRRHKRQREHYKRSLDTVAERFGIRGGPVVGTDPLPHR